MSATPDPKERRALASIAGMAAPPGRRPDGCFFHPRCEYAIDACRSGNIPAIEMGKRHLSWCLRSDDLPRLDLSGKGVDHKGLRADADAVLRAEGVRAFHGDRQVIHGASLVLHERECLALVGESGSGKTTLARCIIGLHRDYEGNVVYRDEVLAAHARQRTPEIRRRLQYVFQSPYSSLNPRQSVGDIVALPIRFFFHVRRNEARRRAAEAFERVGLPSALADRFPSELSGGERQRVAIARALVCGPDVLICDEITSALDVSVQAAIVDLLMRMRQEEGLSMLFITHNLALVRNLADRVMILNEGKVVEGGDVDAVLDQPREAYTQRLLSDTPTISDQVALPPVG